MLAQNLSQERRAIVTGMGTKANQDAKKNLGRRSLLSQLNGGRLEFIVPSDMPLERAKAVILEAFGKWAFAPGQFEFHNGASKASDEPNPAPVASGWGSPPVDTDDSAFAKAIKAEERLKQANTPMSTFSLTHAQRDELLTLLDDLACHTPTNQLSANLERVRFTLRDNK